MIQIKLQQREVYEKKRWSYLLNLQNIRRAIQLRAKSKERKKIEVNKSKLRNKLETKQHKVAKSEVRNKKRKLNEQTKIEFREGKSKERQKTRISAANVQVLTPVVKKQSFAYQLKNLSGKKLLLLKNKGISRSNPRRLILKKFRNRILKLYKNNRLKKGLHPQLYRRMLMELSFEELQAFINMQNKRRKGARTLFQETFL